MFENLVSYERCKTEIRYVNFTAKFEFQLKYDKLVAHLQKKNKEYKEFYQKNDLQTESERLKVGNWKREKSYQATRGAKRYKVVKSK